MPKILEITSSRQPLQRRETNNTPGYRDDSPTYALPSKAGTHYMDDDNDVHEDHTTTASS